jgi:hypothetical protein
MRLPLATALTALSAVVSAAEPPVWSQGFHIDVNDVKSIGHEGKNGPRAAAAARRLADLPPEAIPSILEACRGANPLAANLLRSAVETIADRARAKGTPLPTDDLVAFIGRTDQAPRARRLAWELVRQADPKTADRLLDGMLRDPSPELRRDAVARRLDEADRLKAAGKNDDAKASYEQALAGAIDDDQVRKAVEGLKTFGVTVDIQKHFGFVTNWQVIGPFDNHEMKGFAAVYPPEQKVDLAATYQGKLGEVAWKPISTSDPYGVLDIAKQLGDDKGSAMYFAAEFDAPAARPAEIRIGTPNAWKLWLNGEFLFGREEYHRGEELDQYRVPAQFKAGKNLILLKVLQNEQTDASAQSYKFRLRVCDSTGQAILPATPQTARP